MIYRTIYAKQDEVEERGHCGQKYGAAEDPNQLIDQFVTGPMTRAAVNAASMAFKTTLIERARAPSWAATWITPPARPSPIRRQTSATARAPRPCSPANSPCASRCPANSSTAVAFTPCQCHAMHFRMLARCSLEDGASWFVMHLWRDLRLEKNPSCRGRWTLPAACRKTPQAVIDPCQGKRRNSRAT